MNFITINNSNAFSVMTRIMKKIEKNGEVKIYIENDKKKKELLDLALETKLNGKTFKDTSDLYSHLGI